MVAGRTKVCARAGGGFTLSELLVTLAIVAIVVAFAGPAMHDFIMIQRLKGVNGELVTDLQFARNEAVTRGKQVHMALHAGGTSSASCYTIYTHLNNAANACDCTQPAGLRCPAGLAKELKTVEVPLSTTVQFGVMSGQVTYFYFEPVTGGIAVVSGDSPLAGPNQFVIYTLIDETKKLTTTVGTSGRPTVCQPSTSRVTGYPTC